MMELLLWWYCLLVYCATSIPALANYYGDTTMEVEMSKRWISFFTSFDEDKDDCLTKNELSFGSCLDAVLNVGKTNTEAKIYCKKWFIFYEKHILQEKFNITVDQLLDDLFIIAENRNLNDYFEEMMTAKVDAMDLNADGYITHPDEWNLNDFGFSLDGFHILVTDELINAYKRFYTDVNFQLKV